MATAKQAPNLITRTSIPTPSGYLSVITSLPLSPPATSPRFESTIGQPIQPPAILFIHGNSSSSQVFRDFFFPPSSPSSPRPLCATHRLISFDLPGHGSSPNAPSNPPPAGLSTHYCMPSYAHCALAILDHLEITNVLVFGWSLGGHIAIELLPLLNPPPPATTATTTPSKHHPYRRCKGICLTGTPPVPLGNPDLGFKLRPSPSGKPFAAEAPSLSESDILLYATASAGVPFGGTLESFHIANVRHTDGRARSDMWRSFRAGIEGVDQRKVVEATDTVSTAVINGAGEEAVELDYLDSVKWGNLWRGKCVRLEGLGHAPFWEDFGRFEMVFGEWVGSVEW